MGGYSIAISSLKGGVGKTTLALNLGYALAKRGWRTVVVDADPQGGMTYALAGKGTTSGGLVSVPADLDESEVEKVIVRSKNKNFSIIPFGYASVEEVEKWSDTVKDGEFFSKLFSYLSGVFDIVMVDTPPGISGSTVGVLKAVDYVISPLQAEPMAARSVSKMLESIVELRKKGSKARLLAFVINMLAARDKNSLEVALSAWKALPPEVVLEVTIPKHPIFLEASRHGLPVALIGSKEKSSMVGVIFDQLAAIVEERVGLVEVYEHDRTVSLFD